MSGDVVAVTAFYKFFKIESDQVPSIKERLEAFAAETGLRGLVVLGAEGINSTCAGTPDVVGKLRDFLGVLFPGEEIPHKESVATRMPFARFKVDVRPEIVTIKNLDISADESLGTHLSPAEWHQALSSESDILLVDTRNDYEFEIGTFQDAIDPRIQKFSDFKNFMEAQDVPKGKKIFLFCTGGIRCEKAVPEVKRLGFENVYQLEGGILKYLEEYPEGLFRGECFVFDRRVAVDSNLQPTKIYSSCPHCGNPGKERILCKNCETETVVCHRCVGRNDRMSCSKNCAHHIRRKTRSATAAMP